MGAPQQPQSAQPFCCDSSSTAQVGVLGIGWSLFSHSCERLLQPRQPVPTPPRPPASVLELILPAHLVHFLPPTLCVTYRRKRGQDDDEGWAETRGETTIWPVLLGSSSVDSRTSKRVRVRVMRLILRVLLLSLKGSPEATS